MLVDNLELTTYTFVNSGNYSYLYVFISTVGVEPSLTVTSENHVQENALKARGTLVGNFGKPFKTAACASVAPGETFDLTASTITNIYAAWDALVTANPSVITKTLLGYGGRADGTADNTLPIYVSMISKCWSRATFSVLLITCGVHGDEKSPVWGTLQFVTQMLANWRTDEALAAIFFKPVHRKSSNC